MAFWPLFGSERGTHVSDLFEDTNVGLGTNLVFCISTNESGEQNTDTGYLPGTWGYNIVHHDL